MAPRGGVFQFPNMRRPPAVRAPGAPKHDSALKREARG